MLPYLEGLQSMFHESRDEARALAMKKYMKGRFEYFGIPSPRRREIIKEFLKNSGFPGDEQFEPVIYDCWTMPQREFQYFAMELAGRLVRKAELCRVDLYEYMAENKSWWDTVDYIASNLAGPHFRKFPDAIRPYTERWMASGNMWLQRTAILFQLKYKEQTDLVLLSEYIGRLQGSKEFFINKAIGWILREYSKTDANWVQAFV